MRIHPGASLIALLGIAAVLEATVPFSVGATLMLRVVPGALALGAGSMLLFWAIDTLRGAGTAIDPFREPSSIATKGPFRFSRNPMYLANLLWMVGFMFLTASAWFLLVTGVQFALLDIWVIPWEEKELKRAFPEAAQGWFSGTRRWL